jgi:hypothetical protein
MIHKKIISQCLLKASKYDRGDFSPNSALTFDLSFVGIFLLILAFVGKMTIHFRKSQISSRNEPTTSREKTYYSIHCGSGAPTEVCFKLICYYSSLHFSATKTKSSIKVFFLFLICEVLVRILCF